MFKIKFTLTPIGANKNQRRLRHQWCNERRIWMAEWNEIIFTDEWRFCLQHHDGHIRIWRHHGERMLNSCIMHRHTTVPQEFILSLFKSVPMRVAVVISNNGGYSGYWFWQQPHFTEVNKFNHLILGQHVIYKIIFCDISFIFLVLQFEWPAVYKIYFI